MPWALKSCDTALATTLAEQLQLPPIVARLLVQRGIKSGEAAHRFLKPALEHLHAPGLLRGLDTAVARIERAIAHKESILIYGDYDVDGTVAIVILKTCIELLGGVTEFHVPHRLREGYGMRDDVIERAAAAGIRLVISVDTGIRAFQAAETARRVGLDLIVTDHHLPETAEGLPRALAVLNPNQPDCGYPCKELCGAGVAFKVAQALLTRAGRAHLLPSFLKMVAIATIADAVPLTGENRVIAKLGLDGLRRPVNGGLKALLEVAQLDPSQRKINAADIAFRVAPRINAAGRMDIAADVVELFTSRNEARQRELAAKLNELNAQRQGEEKRIVAEIERRLEEDPKIKDAYCIVLAGDDWHRGVIGIVATRVVERTGRPALVVACDLATGEAYGSGRSISAFHLLEALESPNCKPLFTRCGGHAHAVGFALPMEKVPDLARHLDTFARTRLRPQDFEPAVEADSELRLGDISPQLLQALSRLEPFGMGNREPLFIGRGLRVLQPPSVMKEAHIKLRVGAAEGDTSRPYDALGWRMAKHPAIGELVAGESCDAAFTLSQSTNPDFPGITLELRDLTLAAVGATAAD